MRISRGLHCIPCLQQGLIDFLRDGRLIDKNKLPTAKLGRDIVLPTCWHPFSIVHMLGQIGEGRKCGTWQQDSNHVLHYWFPMNIFWVGGGNHSITQGILLAEGEVKACEGFDLTDLTSMSGLMEITGSTLILARRLECLARILHYFRYKNGGKSYHHWCSRQPNKKFRRDRMLPA